MYIINCIYHCISQTDKQEFGNRTFHYGSIADRSIIENIRLCSIGARSIHVVERSIVFDYRIQWNDWCLILFNCRLDTMGKE